MRKKLLRSRTGFEKPESREEAIMQNILGASNVLEPAESNIEEILQAILYNTPYTKEAEFEIEKILLAIKNNGTYDGEGESRDMKILIAILNDLDYSEEAESRIEELFIEWLLQRSSIKVLEGVPPLTFTSRGFPLINYLIEGNTVQNGTPTPDNPVDVNGVGVRTENICNITSGTNLRANSGGSGTYISDNNISVYMSGTVAWSGIFCQYTNDNIIVDDYYTLSFIPICATNSTLQIELAGTSKKISFASGTRISVTVQATANNRNIAFYGGDTVEKTIIIKDIQIEKGSTAKPYEPYGYKISITCGGVTTDIYIGDSPLYDGDTISMTDTGIEIPTAYGNNVLTVDTAVQPSNVYIEYK